MHLYIILDRLVALLPLIKRSTSDTAWLHVERSPLRVPEPIVQPLRLAVPFHQFRLDL